MTSLHAAAVAAGSIAGPELDRWRRLLGGELPVLDLPADHPRLPNATRDTAQVPVRLYATTVAELRLLAHPCDTSPALALALALAATYQVLLAHLCRQTDIVVLLERAGGPVPLRTVLDRTTTFRQVLAQIRETVRLADENPPACATAVAELPPHTFADIAHVRIAVDDPHDAEPAPGPWDLRLALRPGHDNVLGTLGFAVQRLDRSTAERTAAMITFLAGRLAAAPDQPVLAVSPVPPDERDRILYRMHDHRRPEITYRTMAEPFEEQVRRTPNAVALIGDEGAVSYAELNTRANRLARLLRDLGARPGSFVAVSMQRSADLMIALYAVAKSGAAYVPVDPGLPDGRIAFMLADSTPVAVLTDDATRARIPDGTWEVLAPGADAQRWDSLAADDLPALPGTHLIHLLYTSGTTGRPKAVVYPVDGALADIFWLNDAYPYRAGDTALFKTSYGFDVSIWEIFWPLYCGARIAVCPPDGHRDPQRLRELIDRHLVTAMFMVPSMMPRFYDCTSEGSCPSLRWVFCGGEPVTPRVRDGFHTRFAADLIDCYGPTELGCVAETVLPVEPGAPVMVGRPPPHRRIYLLDDSLEPAPVGVPGELFVGGEVGVAHGYHDRPGLTGERFIADPFGPRGARIYRTGDLCRYRSDGVLEHLGRIGRQVKIRGVRIELAEIEAVLTEHEDVAQCVVTVVAERDSEIAAFVTPKRGHVIAAPALVAHGRQMLPEHMIPATVTVLDDIPTFVNGKTDLEQLLTRIDRSGATAEPGEPPTTPTEARVAGIFQDILGLNRVSVTAGFFALGGHSFLVFKLIEMCAAEFATELAVQDVLAALTVRRLAALLDGHGAAASTAGTVT